MLLMMIIAAFILLIAYVIYSFSFNSIFILIGCGCSIVILIVTFIISCIVSPVPFNIIDILLMW